MGRAEQETVCFVMKGQNNGVLNLQVMPDACHIRPKETLLSFLLNPASWNVLISDVWFSLQMRNVFFSSLQSLK